LKSEKAGVKEKSKFREYAEAIVIAFVLAMIIRTFVVQAFKIPSGSMIPTLLVGDHILVNKFIYGIKIPLTDIRLFLFKAPRRNDIIVFACPIDPEKDYIKRVIGVGGEQIKIVNKRIYINGELFNDPYGKYSDNFIIPEGEQPRDNMGPITVPLDSFFVMGDNRDSSYDSRFWGTVKLNAIKGKAFLIYWSWNKLSHWVRWRRIGSLIH
jgi:signal peptidase I